MAFIWLFSREEMKLRKKKDIAAASQMVLLNVAPALHTTNTQTLVKFLITGRRPL